MGNKCDKFEEKNYKNDSEIEMDIELEEYKVFPYCEIKGKITLKPKNKKIKFDNSELKIILKLTQFIKYEFRYKSLIGKHSLVDVISEQKIYRSKKESINVKLQVSSKKKEKFYPSFEYRNKDYFLFVRHLLTIEIPDLKTSNSTGIIVCKLPEIENIIKLEDLNKRKYFTIFKDFPTPKGRVVYEFSIKKLIYSLTEAIPVKLIVNTKELEDTKIKSIEFSLEKRLKVTYKINWKLWGEDYREKNKTLFSKKYEGNEVEVKNKIFKISENIEIDKNDLPEFVKENNIPQIYEKEIARFIKLDDDFIERDEQRAELNPSIKTDLFFCEYKVKLNVNFNDKKVDEIKEEFLIDLYTFKPTSIDKMIEPYFKSEENSSFESQDGEKSDYKSLEEKKDKTCDDFINLEKNDYRSVLNNKKK